MMKDQTIEQQFNIEDSMSELMKTSWVMKDLEGDFHKKALVLQVGKKCPKETEKEILMLISKAIVRSKKFYDFNMTLDIKMVTKGNFGLIFRMVDAFNYYTASVDETEITFLRIKDGESELLGSKQLSSPLKMNLWYNVKVTAVGSNFEVYVVRERDFADPNRYLNLPRSEGLGVEDQYFKHGHFGVFADYTSRMYFDSLLVTPLPCALPEPADKEDYMLKSLFTSRYEQDSWASLVNWYEPKPDSILEPKTEDSKYWLMKSKSDDGIFSIFDSNN